MLPRLPAPTLRTLSDEIDAASTLLRHGIDTLSNYSFAARDADAVFVCLASGSEKLLKLSIGLHTLSTTGSWPPPKTMRTQFGHRICDLDTEVRRIIQGGLGSSTAPGHLQQELQGVSADTVATRTLATLERYADQGRFYNLDFLGGKTQDTKSPAQMWDELEQSLIQNDPELATSLIEDWHKARKDLNKRVRSSFIRWCQLVISGWKTGVMGDLAKACSGQLTLT